MKFNLLNKIMFFHRFTSYSSFPDFTSNVITLWSLLAHDFLKNKRNHIFFNTNCSSCYTAIIFVKHYLLYLMILISINITEYYIWRIWQFSRTLDIINSKTHASFPLYGKNYITLFKSNSPSEFGTCNLPVLKYTCNTHTWYMYQTRQPNRQKLSCHTTCSYWRYKIDKT